MAARRAPEPPALHPLRVLSATRENRAPYDVRIAWRRDPNPDVVQSVGMFRDPKRAIRTAVGFMSVIVGLFPYQSTWVIITVVDTRDQAIVWDSKKNPLEG